MSKVAVFIGRFQPFHNGHKNVIDLALKQCDKVIIVIGSSFEPRTARNPFSFDERSSMILNSYIEDYDRIITVPSINRFYNDIAWAYDVRASVKENTDLNDEIFLIGYAKDHSSFYLKMFPEWHSINVEPTIISNQLINSTDIRDLMFKTLNVPANLVPQSTVNVISNIDVNIIYRLYDEHAFITKYKKQWEAAPYPVIFTTTDAIIVQSGHILMVRRGAMPGKGLMALPGGFVDVNERILDSCVREVYEETKIDLPKPVLYGAIKNQHVFDSPYRSQRGRTITHGFFFQLNNGVGNKPLPKVKGSDDADKAFWIPLTKLDREEIYEDHADIIEFFTGIKIS